MPRTLSQVIETTRSLLQDQVPAQTGYRWSDADLARYASEAVAEAYRLRPDLFIDGSPFDGLANALPYWGAFDVASTVPLPDSYTAQLVNYMVGRAQMRDDEFANDGRAAALMQVWGASLTNNGGKR